MRILLLSAEYPPMPGGIGDYTEQLGRALVARGQSVCVLTIADRQFQIIDLGGFKDLWRPAITNRPASWGWASWAGIRSALAHMQPDIVHIQYQTGAYAMHPAINLLPWRLRQLRQRPRVVVTAHDLLPPYLFPKAGPVRGWVTRRLLRDADALVVTNTADLAQLSNAQRIAPTLIPIGSNIAVEPPPNYDRAAWRAGLHIADGETLVAYFGLISRSKGLDVLLAALAQLPASVRLLVIGGPGSAAEDQVYAKRIRQQIAAQALSDRVIVTGHCPAEQVSAHLLAADLAALPFSDGASYRRGSLLAALAHGLPVITTGPPKTNRSGSLASASGERLAALHPLIDGANCLLVAPHAAQALADAIGRLASEAELRDRLARGGRALAQHFGWPAIAEQHEALYARLALRQPR